jgi:hypothetical protein
VNNGEPTIPNYVIDDLDANPGLVRRWIEDAAFRRELLEAEDPATVASSHGFELQAQTSTWIRERVAARGLGLLLGAEYPQLLPA